MGKQSQLEKAIAAIDADIAVLEHAKARLLKEQAVKPSKRKAKPALPAFPPNRIIREGDAAKGA